VKHPVRLQLLWRTGSRWLAWGSTTVVSAGRGGLRGSRQYTLNIGPVVVGLMLPLSRRGQADEERRMAPALRRVEKYRTGRRSRKAR
jgi:hypothetical protein